MIQNTVQTLIDYVKDLSGQDNLSTARAIRALNFAVDHLSVLKLLKASKTNPDSSNHDDVSRASVTTGDATLSMYGGNITQDEAVTFRFLEILNADGTYTRLDPIDERDEAYVTLQGQSGTPRYYDVSGQIIRPLPVPNDSFTYRLTYGRVHPRYSESNLTQTTGLLPNEEEYVALYAADRVMIRMSDSERTAVRNELTVKQREIEDMVGLKDQNTVKRMKPKIDSTFNTTLYNSVVR
jgi:hypothetical protein